MVLASTAATVSLDDLAELADKIVEVAAPTVNAVHTPQLTSEVEQLRSEVARLQDLVKSLSTRRKPRRSPTPTRLSSDTNTQSLCWYHQKYIVSQPTNADLHAGLNPSRLFYVRDCLSGLQFLVDTGAEVSIVSPSRTNRTNCQFSLVDVRRHRLSDSVTHLKVQGILADTPPSGISRCPTDPDDPYLSLVSEFPAGLFQ